MGGKHLVEGMTPNSQTVVLDTTLRDLFSMDGDTADQDIVLINVLPSTEAVMTPPIPLSTKFISQNNVPSATGSDVLSRHFLRVVPQNFGFLSGKMPLIMFNADEGERDTMQPMRSSSAVPGLQLDAFRTFDQLLPSQQPELSFVNNPGDIALHPGRKFVIGVFPLDCLLHLPSTVDLEVHYLLQSKADLARSGLPTPESEIIDTKLRPNTIHNDRLLDAEVARMLAPIHGRPLPFVVKMPQAAAGHGTFLVRTESDRREAIEVLTSEQKKLLRKLNESNQHLRPCSLVVQKMIPGDAVALSLFITRTGRAIMTSCCKQLIDPAGHWGGAFISYKEQDQLQQQYAALVEKLARFMHGRGYYGPLGVDVMTDQDGHQLVIDLNVRVSGSHPLGFLKNHFSVKRKLHEAAIFFPLFLTCSRLQFEHLFETELSEGSLIVNGWYHDDNPDCKFTSVAGLSLAAEDPPMLGRFIERVNLCCIPLPAGDRG